MRIWLCGLALGLLSSSGLAVLPSLPTTAVVAGCAIALASWVHRGAPALPGERSHWVAGAGYFGFGVTAGLVVGIVHGSVLVSHQLPAECVRTPLEVSGQIVSLPRVTVFGQDSRQQRFEFQLKQLTPARCRGPQRLLLAYYGAAALKPGQHWRFEVRLKRPWGLVNPGSFNMQSWFAQTGIHATGSVRNSGMRPLQSPPGVDSLHHRIRGHLSSRIASLPLSRDSAAVLQAVTVADRSGIDTALWRLCQHYGVNHLLVISGLHIGLVAAVGYGLGRVVATALLLGVWQRLAIVAPGLMALGAATVYTALAGFSLATVRALVMLACVVAASWCGRAAGSWRNLLLAATALLLINPLAGLGSGFWLSFGAVACLLWLALWQAQNRRWWRYPGTHLYMSLAMLPLCGWWFGGVSQVSAVANLVLVPLLGFYVVPLALLAAGLSLLGFDAADTLWLWSAKPLESLLPAGFRLDQSGSQWLYRSLAPGAAEAAIALLGVALAALPGSWRLKCLLPVLVLPLLLTPREASSDSETAVHLVFIDVGQGTSVLVYNRSHALLYDTGGGVAGGNTVALSAVIPLLRHRGIPSLDSLIVSHGDSDHSAGLGDVLQALPVGQLWTGLDLLPAASYRPCRAGSAWQWPDGSVTFRILAPAAEQGLSRNNGSCVLQIETAGQRILLPGDIDAQRERGLLLYWGEELASDWLLAAHHGSASSSSWAWLKTVQPRHVVFSHGYANRFGHPHPAVVQRSEAQGANTLSTARQGALELVFEPEGSVRVIGHRRLRRYFWM